MLSLFNERNDVVASVGIGFQPRTGFDHKWKIFFLIYFFFAKILLLNMFVGIVIENIMIMKNQASLFFLIFPLINLRKHRAQKWWAKRMGNYQTKHLENASQKNGNLINEFFLLKKLETKLFHKPENRMHFRVLREKDTKDFFLLLHNSELFYSYSLLAQAIRGNAIHLQTHQRILHIHLHNPYLHQNA